MRRRRLLSLVVAAAAGCTGTYRAGGPRTVPTAPPTDATSSTADPVEARAQAVVRPLNEAYRVVRLPLDSFEVAPISDAQVSTATEQVERARAAVETFAADVGAPPARYRSLPTLVTTHERLVDALAVTVDLHAGLVALGEQGADAVDGDDLSDRVATLRSLVDRLATAGEDLADVAADDPTIPRSLFLTPDRLEAFATGLRTQATAVGRLLDVTARTTAATVDWHDGLDAFERGAFDAAESAFVDARAHHQDAAALLESDLGTAGSFADVTDHRSCVVEAGLEAVPSALDAVEAGRAGDAERAQRLRDDARTTWERCGD